VITSLSRRQFGECVLFLIESMGWQITLYSIMALPRIEKELADRINGAFLVSGVGAGGERWLSLH